MSETQKREPVVAAISWIIGANKPVYLLYVWFYVGSGPPQAAWTMLAAPLYAASEARIARFATSFGKCWTIQPKIELIFTYAY
jgi:hypothetical protein